MSYKDDTAEAFKNTLEKFKFRLLSVLIINIILKGPYLMFLTIL